MASIDDEILQGAQEDAREVAFIQNYMGVENRERFTEEDIYYCLDVLLEHLDTLNDEADADGYIEVDTEQIARHIQKKAKKEGMGPYDLDALILLVDAELEYNEQLEN
ncbi:MAG: hypothetical protein IKN44_07795 [Bacteroidaceae bacterium]|jgi:hypothetical protein|nr:hypothetical protein [Bacteroidaceae bacterium]MBR3619634.1 hypothetical protein [Bacteroidaceae bacterium]